MIAINYQKRKNQELFKTLEDSRTLFLSKPQNYIPIYQRFFSLNETNYNNINLNHKWYLSNVEKNKNENNVFFCRLKNVDTQKTKDKYVFIKMAPLLDPYKYLVGKYNAQDPKLFVLPQIDSNESNTNAKFMDVNNSAYVDGFFIYLSCHLIYSNNFSHGVDYYGSFLAVKNNYKLNIFDDLEYLVNSDFFNKNKNILFKVDNYEHLFNNEDAVKLKPIKIQHEVSAKSNISIKSIDNDMYENIFTDCTTSHINLNELKDLSLDLVDITNSNMMDPLDNKTSSIKSGSTCSSRTSYTSSENSNCDECDMDGKENEESEENNENNKQVTDCRDNDCDDNDCDEPEEWEEISSDEELEEIIEATIPKFPVQVIFMENCENTFDNLILTNELKAEEWYSAFMQIIMILITYQKAFSFTHNDLHTNNVMYVNTNKKFLYYCYKKKYYKVPTFGRLFKIIDFGRSIYKFGGKVFCSDSFQTGGDAATQYNTEPYFNEKKARLEPNFSFDICRLACSIFDYMVDDMEEVKDLSNCDPVKRLVVEWCLDDKGINMLYKNNGADRYPDFKLYKMISRCVHNHTPQAQLDRPEFNAFSKFKGEIPEDVINIDNIPAYN
jgi:hypothetical protein